MPDSLLCWTAWTNRWCLYWWQRRRLWWSSPWSLRHVAFYVLRWFWHPDFQWLVSIHVSKQDITIPVQLVDKRAACKSLDPCGTRKVATLTQCWVLLAPSCACQLSPVVCSHSYWTFSARQTHPARPYRMGRRLHPFTSIECLVFQH